MNPENPWIGVFGALGASLLFGGIFVYGWRKRRIPSRGGPMVEEKKSRSTFRFGMICYGVTAVFCFGCSLGLLFRILSR